MKFSLEGNKILILDNDQKQHKGSIIRWQRQPITVELATWSPHLDILQNGFIQTQLGHKPLQPRILLLKLSHSSGLISILRRSLTVIRQYAFIVRFTLTGPK